MPNVTTNGIQIEYDTFGDKSSPAFLLIAGNGAQLLFWDAEFCELLAKTGLFVIRFDNRDAGLSTKFDEAGVPDIMAVIKAAMEASMLQRHIPWTIWQTTVWGYLMPCTLKKRISAALRWEA